MTSEALAFVLAVLLSTSAFLTHVWTSLGVFASNAPRHVKWLSALPFASGVLAFRHGYPYRGFVSLFLGTAYVLLWLIRGVH